MSVFGLVGAGNYDVAVLETLLKRLRPDIRVIVRHCGNDYRVTTTLGTRLKEFDRIKAAGTLDKVIVVKDSHRADPENEFRKLESAVRASDHLFPVELAVVVRALESWLLADHEGLSRVAEERGTPRQYAPLGRSPEQLPDPKQTLSELLAESNVSYTEAVAVRIAEVVSLERIEQLCRSFTRFKHAAEHC